MKKGAIIEGLFMDIETPQERVMVDRNLANRNNGAAETVVSRALRDVWVHIPYETLMEANAKRLAAR